MLLNRTAYVNANDTTIWIQCNTRRDEGIKRGSLQCSIVVRKA